MKNVKVLRDSINYQKDAIISQAIIKKDAGNLTLFAFDQGQELSEHTAPFDAFVYIVDGEAEILIGGQSQRLQAGETMIMPANIPHALKAVRAFKMLLVMIRN